MHHTFYGCASITTSQRPQIAKKECAPGPGTYDPRKQDEQRIPKWTLKPKLEYTSCFHNNSSFIPPPGSYEVPPSIKATQKSKARPIKLNKQKDRNYGQRNSPILPLQIPSFVDQKSGFTFGYRSQITINQTSPGPKYHINQWMEQMRSKKVQNKSNGFGFGQKNTLQKHSEQSPGPANYSPQKLYSTCGNWTFSKNSRRNRLETSNLVGPGQYNVQFSQSARSFKFGGKYHPIKMESYDASPGSYNIPDTKSKRSAIFRQKSHHEGKQNLSPAPSPFSYDPPSSTLKKGGFTLGKKPEITDSSIENPGPGSYQIETKMIDKVGGYMSRKIQKKQKASQIQDNFYKYNPKSEIVNYKYPQFSFGQSSSITFKLKQKSELGPGSYNILKKSSGQSYSMGKNPRFKPLAKQKSFGNASENRNCYSSFGYLPSYLRANSKNATKQSSVNRITLQK